MSRTEVINAVYTAALSLNTVDKDSFYAFTKDGFYFTVDGMYLSLIHISLHVFMRANGLVVSVRLTGNGNVKDLSGIDHEFQISIDSSECNGRH